MEIHYKEGIVFSKEQISDLFLTDNWSSGKYPDKLFRAINGSGWLLSAWDNDNLVGFINCIDDGCMTCFLVFLIVHPNYQGKGIGSALLQKMKEHYKSYNRIMITTETDNIEFYSKFDFKRNDDDVAMYLKQWGDTK